MVRFIKKRAGKFLRQRNIRNTFGKTMKHSINEFPTKIVFLQKRFLWLIIANDTHETMADFYLVP